MVKYYTETLQQSFEEPGAYIAFLNDLIYYIDVGAS